MASDIDKLIGYRLQVARKALGFTSARAFARHYDIPATTYAQHETGKRSLNPSILTAYCEKLNITPDWLFADNPVRGVITVTAEYKVNLPLLEAILRKHFFPLLKVNMGQHVGKIMHACVTMYAQALKREALSYQRVAPQSESVKEHYMV